MFHPAIAAAMAHERQTDLVKAATRHRAWRAAKAAGREIERRWR
jgi:hypothetical protein